MYARAVQLVEVERLSVDEAALRQGISRTSLYDRLRALRAPTPPAPDPPANVVAGVRGPGRSLGREGAAYVLADVREHAAVFLYELVYTLQNDYGITTDRRTVARFLVSQGFTRKQVGGVLLL